ncbi:MAG TPA: hypothetical protein VI383_09015 [Gemmatimonadales bacterium]|nr:hypothetical protein [Gemmatimonadales bacterium]
MAWRIETVSPRELLQRGGDDGPIPAVRVTKPDQTRVEIWGPALVGDSIAGHATERAIARFYVPLSQVSLIETRHQSFGKTILFVLGVGAGVAVYALLQSLNQY